MRRLTTMFLFALGLLALPSDLRSADPDKERYVKIEIKGEFQRHHDKAGPPSGPRLAVQVAVGQTYAVDFGNMPAPPTEKQLKEWDGKLVVVHGNLVLERDKHPRVYVTQIVRSKPKEMME